MRFDKLFPVQVSSREYALLPCVARNISSGGMFLETREPLPLGTQVKIRFSFPESRAEIVARGEVKNHCFFNYNDPMAGVRLLSGMGVRFLGFEDDGQELLQMSLAHVRTLH